VLVADADVDAGKALANTLAGWGLEPVLVHDGVEAILTIQRILPRAVILDAGLPKMFGFQICELMKRNESLRSIHVVLVGVIYHQDRYRRAPNNLYGADAYTERPQLPEALRPILRGFGLDLAGAAPAPAPQPAVPPAEPEVAPAVSAPTQPAGGESEPASRPGAPTLPPPVAAEPTPGLAEKEAPSVAPEPTAPSPPPGPLQTPQPPAVSDSLQPASADAAPDAAVTDAERLARIIVSDIVLYNPEKFEAGIRDGNVLEALEGELEEGRSHFDQRVELRVRESRDFLAEEMVRVARLRGMK
jgi:CheY-like chemotaxis protein